jgi:hypothetical protein
VLGGVTKTAAKKEKKQRHFWPVGPHLSELSNRLTCDDQPVEDDIFEL